MKQKVLIVGAGGQLGQELQRTAAADVEFVPMTRAQLDITDATAVAECLTAVAPQLAINAAAYTAVDKAESEPEAAHRGNAEGPGTLAQACARQGIRLIHISTDFVFDGTSSQPYRPEAPTAPLGEYGRSKRAGEVAVQRAQPEALILRTGWVYSSFGGNFVKTMLRLMGEREELSVVTDQVGTPTWAYGLAGAVWAAAARPQLSGIYHWSDAGVCSWYDFADAICEEGLALGLLSRPVKIRPIPASEYPTPAQRPAYSVLDKSNSWRDFALEGVHWRRQLRAMLADFKELANA
ncbi:MAG TPA: dTDP-4-dehydrorhamnose reductase [Halioglobus sp.]